MTDWIKKGSRVTLSKIVIKEINNDVVRALMFDQYNNAEAVVVSVWDYPPDDRKFEVNLRPPNHGKLVIRDVDLGGYNASS